MMRNATQARISVTGGGTDRCSGHNWASTLQNYSSTNGFWSLTWEATGNIYGDFPSVGQITTTDATHTIKMRTYVFLLVELAREVVLLTWIGFVFVK